MIDRFIELLGKLRPKETHHEETELKKAVTEEHQRLRVRRARVNRVLADFHRADAVVGGVRSKERR